MQVALIKIFVSWSSEMCTVVVIAYNKLWSARGFVLLTVYYSGDQIEKNEIRGAGSTHGGEVHAGFWWGNLMERDHLEDPGLNGSVALKWIFSKLVKGAWAGLIWPRTGGGHLSTR
jgi:hypothetical protein